MTVRPKWLKKRIATIRKRRNTDFGYELYGDILKDRRAIGTWSEFQHWIDDFSDDWSFRGQSNAHWGLQTSLERKTTQIIEERFGEVKLPLLKWQEPEVHEPHILLEFQRAAHQYLSNTPADDETVDWLALMQHYGAPTRLLDWTRSPYVALYFALEHAQPKQPSAIWALDRNWLQHASSTALKDHGYPNPSDFRAMCKYVNHMIVSQKGPPVIVQADPIRLNDRMTTQQGHHLCNLNLYESFGIRLCRMVFDTPAEEPPVRKVVIRADMRTPLLSELRKMNIHSASLFPGLDGFARSLGMDLESSIAKSKDSPNDLCSFPVAPIED